METIKNNALSVVDFCYGSGLNGAITARIKELPYHNGYHTRNVVEDMDRLCHEFDVDPRVAKIGLLAASAHDIVQLAGTNEVDSAEWLEEQLKCHEVKQRYIETGTLAILGTRPIFDGGTIVSQQAFETDYPSYESQQVSHLLATADLGRLYTPSGPLLGHLLYKEIYPETSFDTLVDFQRGQVNFLSNYEYKYREAGQVLSQKKPEVIAYTAKTLEMLENGQLGTLEEVLDRDVAFMEATV